VSRVGGSVSGGLRFAQCPVQGWICEAECRARAVTDSPQAWRAMATARVSASRAQGRPPWRPWAWAAARPSRVRSRMRSRSISAAMASSIRRPTSICVSLASARTTSACAWGLRSTPVVGPRPSLPVPRGPVLGPPPRARWWATGLGGRSGGAHRAAWRVAAGGERGDAGSAGLPAGGSCSSSPVSVRCACCWRPRAARAAAACCRRRRAR